MEETVTTSVISIEEEGVNSMRHAEDREEEGRPTMAEMCQFKARICEEDSSQVWEKDTHLIIPLYSLPAPFQWMILVTPKSNPGKEASTLVLFCLFCLLSNFLKYYIQFNEVD